VFGGNPIRPSSFLARAYVCVLVAGAALLGSSCIGGYVPPDLTGVDVRLTLLHTSDIHSRVFPYDMVPQFTDENLGLLEENGPFGGAARMSTVLKRERARSKRVLHLDSGDVFQGAPIFNVFEGEVEMLMHNMMGTDAVVAGNHEFDEGASNYAEMLSGFSSFRTLAANYDFASADDPWNNQLDSLIEATAIFDLDGLTIGVVGMGNLSSITSIFEADNGLDVRPLETMSTVMHYTAMLKPQVDVVIVLTHLSLEDDEEIARMDPNVDIVLGGHLHVALDPVKVIPSEVVPGKDVVVCHAGAFAKYVQRLDVVVRDGKVIAHENELFPIDARITPDPAILDRFEDYERTLADEIDLNRTVATTTERLRRFGNNGGDSPLGNLVAEAMQYRAGIETDFALTNSLGIRTDIQGPGSGQTEHIITVEELYNVLPFDNSITTMFLSGSEVQELFDYVSARSSERGCGSQAQIASARFVMDCSNEVAIDATVGGSWADCVTDDDCEDPSEICSALKCGRAIDPSESYELATNNYIAGGGSGFRVLENNTTQQDSGISMRDAVEFYMLQISDNGTVPINEIYVSGDGRISPRL